MPMPSMPATQYRIAAARMAPTVDVEEREHGAEVEGGHRHRRRHVQTFLIAASVYHGWETSGTAVNSSTIAAKPSGNCNSSVAAVLGRC